MSAVSTVRRFTLRTLEAVPLLAQHLAAAYSDSDMIRIGISELLINAIEHGNLGITLEEKRHLLQEGLWLNEIHRRLALPGYRNRQVKATLVTSAHERILCITDEGEGFDWRNWSTAVQTASGICSPSGRGIAIAFVCGFDSVTYKGCGNQVVCRKRIQVTP